MKINKTKLCVLILLCLYIIFSLFNFLNIIYSPILSLPENLNLTSDEYSEFIEQYNFKQQDLVSCVNQNSVKIVRKAFGIFTIKSIDVSVVNEEKIYAGGLPIGISIKSNAKVLKSLNNDYLKNIAINSSSDCANGIGTLTYVCPKTLKFGALGHEIALNKNKNINQVISGKIHKCNLVNIIKSKTGCPGQLVGEFGREEDGIGNVCANTNTGIFGQLYSKEYVKDMPLLAIGNRFLVKNGAAQILTTIDSHPKLYNIQIIKHTSKSKSDSKSMVIRITDKELLKSTGGIVQGMSGSPIIQNNKIIGAVTHVFVNDPIKGYGVYIDWMQQE